MKRSGDPASLVPWKWCDKHNFHFLYGRYCPHCYFDDMADAYAKAAAEKKRGAR